MFLKNSWYVAATGQEVGRTPFARTILNQPVVLYRREDGTAVALEDRCCHRQLPLSLGEVEGDHLICGYHGLRYDGTGQCVEVPGQASPPPGARVRSFPILEKWGWIMIWMGDPVRADECLLPDWWWADHSDWKRSNSHLIEIACNYELITDNLIDVTHLTFVHNDSIGNEAIVDFPQKTEHEDRLVRSTRWIRDRPPPATYRAAAGFTGNIDRALIIEFVPPCFTVNHAILHESGKDPTVDTDLTLFEHAVLSAPTPETETTSHYFFTIARNYGLDDPAVDTVYNEEFVQIFHEDAAVLEAQQRNLDRAPDAEGINIAVDQGPMAARRLLSELRTAEAAT